MKFFVGRPIFAIAMASILVLAGVVSFFQLPVSQYPTIAPPQIAVTSSYTGASAQVIADTVTRPLEEQLNGAEGMIYMSSNSTNGGDSIINLTFEVGYDGSIAQMEALTRSNQAISQLPDEVNQVGVSVTKQSSDFIMLVSLTSPGGSYDQVFLQNYADIHLVDRLARIPGVASVSIFGLRRYAMRIWLNAAKLGGLGLTAMDVKNAVLEQNQQVAAGKLGAAPAPKDQGFQYQLNAQGRLDSVQAFENIIVRVGSDGGILRVKDVARVELGVEDYTGTTSLDGKPAGNVAINQLPDGNALTIADEVRAVMHQLERHFPDDLAWSIHHDRTRFIKASTREVLAALLATVALVVITVFLFLQNLRSTLVPALAIPVSLLGTLAIMLAFGFSLNTLTLLGLVVAVALVVDDGIVLVENVNRHLEAGATDVRQATIDALREVRDPIIATTLVLIAVFVPFAFLPGITGLLYNQFALTIAFAVTLSGINSLTLSPALCGALLCIGQVSRRGPAFRLFNRVFDAFSIFFGRGVRILIRFWYLTAILLTGLFLSTWLLMERIPTAFVPEEDQGFLILSAQLPAGATPERTRMVAAQIEEILKNTTGVAQTIQVTGFDLLSGVEQPYAGFAIPVLTPWNERATPELQIKAIRSRIQSQVSKLRDAEILVFNGASVPGLGSVGGFDLQLQDLSDLGIDKLSVVASAFIDAARKRPEIASIHTTFDPSLPQRFLELDRIKAKTLGLSLDDVFSTLQINLGSLYVNQFGKFGRLYRVYLQADRDERATEQDLLRLQARNDIGEMIPLSALAKLSPMVGPYNISHYNEYTSVHVNGSTAPGYGSGQAITAMEQVAAEVLPEEFGYEWTDLVYQQKKVGNLAPLVFALSLICVFLVLAALYESWSMPLIILLTVPVGLLGALSALMARDMSLDVYGQVGLVMLIGLVAKNSILIVDFARRRHKDGADLVQAAVEAAHMRLRPILMTALAFVIGLLPLVVATGAGAAARQSLGTVVVGGLALATVLIVTVPATYFMIGRLAARSRKLPDGDADGTQAANLSARERR